MAPRQGIARAPVDLPLDCPAHRACEERHKNCSSSTLPAHLAHAAAGRMTIVTHTAHRFVDTYDTIYGGKHDGAEGGGGARHIRVLPSATSGIFRRYTMSPCAATKRRNARLTAFWAHAARRQNRRSSATRETTPPNPGCPGPPIAMARSLAGRLNHPVSRVPTAEAHRREAPASQAGASRDHSIAREEGGGGWCM